MPVACPIVSSWYIAVPLGLRSPNVVFTQIGTSVSSELDTDQGEGIWEQLRYAAKQLDERVNLHTYHVPIDEYSDFPNPPKNDPILLDWNDKLPLPLNWRLHLSEIMTTFLPCTKRKPLLSVKSANIRKNLDSYGKNQCKDIGKTGGESNDSDISMSTVKSLYYFDEKWDWLPHSYFRKAYRLRKQIELFHMTDEIRQSGKSALTPLRAQTILNPRILFAQGKQPQEHRREISKNDDKVEHWRNQLVPEIY